MVPSTIIIIYSCVWDPCREETRLGCSVFLTWPRQAAEWDEAPGRWWPGHADADHWSQSGETGPSLARESSPGGELTWYLVQSRLYSKELETEYVLCCLLWPGLQMKPFTDPSPRISVSGQTSLLTVACIIVTGVNLFHFVLPSQETHNLLCLSNLIIWLTLIISALLSRRGFGPR